MKILHDANEVSNSPNVNFGRKSLCYLDNSGTTYSSPEARDAMLRILELPYNPSTFHQYGRKARACLEEAREKFLNFLDTKSHKLLFTSSCTEANNLILNNFEGKNILISSIEHPSIYEYSKYHNIDIVSVDSNGRLRLDELESMMAKKNYDLVSVIYVNNEIGVVQDFAAISSIVHKYGSLLHSDITQAMCKVKIDMGYLDFSSFSAHKFHGPVGCGGVVYPDNIVIKPQLYGGGQEFRARSGTENLAAIMGAAAALNQMDDSVGRLRDFLEKEICEYSPDSFVIGQKAMRAPHISMITMPNVHFNLQLMHFDLYNIAVSAGSACSSARISGSRILQSLSLPENLVNQAIRVSLSKYTTISEIEYFIEVWEKIFDQFRDQI